MQLQKPKLPPGKRFCIRARGQNIEILSGDNARADESAKAQREPHAHSLYTQQRRHKGSHTHTHCIHSSEGTKGTTHTHCIHSSKGTTGTHTLIIYTAPSGSMQGARTNLQLAPKVARKSVCGLCIGNSGVEPAAAELTIRKQDARACTRQRNISMLEARSSVCSKMRVTLKAVHDWEFRIGRMQWRRSETSHRSNQPANPPLSATRMPTKPSAARTWT